MASACWDGVFGHFFSSSACCLREELFLLRSRHTKPSQTMSFPILSTMFVLIHVFFSHFVWQVPLALFLVKFYDATMIDQIAV